MSNHEEIYIVGGGPSLKGFDFKKLAKKHTLVINKAIFYVPTPTYFITMDYIFYKLRLRRSNQQKDFDVKKCSKFFVVNMASENIEEKDGIIQDSRYGMIYKFNKYDIIIKSHNVRGMGFSFSDFRNGDNSGHCALQLAILLGYRKIHLLGMDFNFIADKQKHTHFHEGYSQNKTRFNENLNQYYKYYVEAIEDIKKKYPEIKIYNYSKNSPLNNILKYKKLGDIKS